MFCIAQDGRLLDHYNINRSTDTDFFFEYACPTLVSKKYHYAYFWSNG